MNEERTVKTPSGELNYTLDRGKWKNVYLCISSGKLIIKTPLRFPISKVEQAILEKLSWINSKLKSYKIPISKIEHTYINGDVFYILGVPFTLEIIQSQRNKNSVNIVDDKIIVEIFKGEVSAVVEKYYKEIAQKEIFESFDRIVKLTGLIPKKITIKSLEKSWGRCSSTGNISISKKIILYPKSVLDYVVLHELSHLKHLNHSKEFWAYVASFMPNYLEERNKLR